MVLGTADQIQEKIKQTLVLIKKKKTMMFVLLYIII